MIADYGADYFAELAVGKQPAPSSWWLSLLHTMPYPSIAGDDLVYYEIAEAGRTELASASFSDASGGIVNYTQELSFEVAATDWGIVVGYAFTNSDTDGDVTIIGEFPDQLEVLTGQRLVIPQGTISIAFVSEQAGDDE